MSFDVSELQNRIEDACRKSVGSGISELAANIAAEIELAYEARMLPIYQNGDHWIERRFLLIPVGSPVHHGPGMGQLGQSGGTT